METVYINGKAKKQEFPNGGHCFDFDIDIEQVNELLEALNKARAEHGLEPTTRFPFRMAERRETDQYGNTHYIKQREQDLAVIKELISGNKPKPEAKESEPTDDLPF